MGCKAMLGKLVEINKTGQGLTGKSRLIFSQRENKPKPTPGSHTAIVLRRCYSKIELTGCNSKKFNRSAKKCVSALITHFLPCLLR